VSRVLWSDKIGLWVYVIYFPTHSAGVTNTSHHYNLSLVVKIYIACIGVIRSSAAPVKKTTGLFSLSCI